VHFGVHARELIDQLVGRAVELLELALAGGAALDVLGQGVEARGAGQSQRERAKLGHIGARSYGHGCPLCKTRRKAGKS
jgi:hypothetical protein